MKLRTIALVLTVALASAAAHAQSGAYLMFDTQQFTQEGVFVNPGTHSNIDRPWLFGTTYGIYYDVTHLPYIGKLKTGPVLVGIDARGDVLRDDIYGSQIDREDGIFSLRVSTKRPSKYGFGAVPYIQGGFGIGHTRNPFRSYYNNDFIYQVSVGVDHPLHGRFKKFDWRVLEASAGTLANYPTGYFAANGGDGLNQSNYLITLSTGLVFRIH